MSVMDADVLDQWTRLQQLFQYGAGHNSSTVGSSGVAAATASGPLRWLKSQFKVFPGFND
jgi:hypothetical protein